MLLPIKVFYLYNHIVGVCEALVFVIILYVSSQCVCERVKRWLVRVEKSIEQREWGYGCRWGSLINVSLSMGFHFQPSVYFPMFTWLLILHNIFFIQFLIIVAILLQTFLAANICRITFQPCVRVRYMLISTYSLSIGGGRGWRGEGGAVQWWRHGLPVSHSQNMIFMFAERTHTHT